MKNNFLLSGNGIFVINQFNKTTKVFHLTNKVLFLLSFLLLSSTGVFAQGQGQGTPQAQQKWNTTGNSATGTEFIGTTNNTSLIFKTNNSKAFEINPSGDIFMNKFSGTGTGIIGYGTDGKIEKVPFNNNFSQVLGSNGVWQEISTFTGLKLNNNDIVQTSSGNFGIGTSTPSSKLDVNGSASISNNLNVGGDFTFSNNLISYRPSIGADPAVLGWGIPAVNINEIKRLAYCLAPVSPTVNMFQGLLYSSGINWGSNQLNVMRMGFDGANGIIDIAGSTSPRLLLNYYCGKDIDMCTGNDGGNIHMTTTTNGKVGIGVNEPTEKLDLGGNLKLNSNTIYLKNDIYHGLKYTTTFGGVTGLDGPALFGWNGGVLGSTNTGAGEKVALRWDENGNVNISKGTNGFVAVANYFEVGPISGRNSNIAMQLWADDKVGMYLTSRYHGTENGYALKIDIDNAKTKALAVRNSTSSESEEFIVFGDGHVFARDIIVKLGNLQHPDYVFDNEYKLLNLNDLEAYLKINKHLPNVPSKAQVEQSNGISLSEMSTKQLEKIEELTLYIIELNKKLNEQELAIKALQNK